MKQKKPNETYYEEKEDDIMELLNYFKLDDLTPEEKMSLLLPLVDSQMKAFYPPTSFKMPFDMMPHHSAEHYNNRVLLVLLKYILQSNNKLDHLKNVTEQNNKLIEQNQQIINLLTKISEKE